METGALTPWRDLAIVLLGIEAFVVVLVPGVAFFFAVKGLRAVKLKIRRPLSLAQLWAVRIQHGTTRVTDAVAGVPIRAYTASAQASAIVRSMVRTRKRVSTLSNKPPRGQPR